MHSKEKNMEASLTYAQSSVKKVLIITRMIRGMEVNKAIGVLEQLPNKSAKVLLKLLNSVKANIINNGKMKDDNQFCVHKIDIGRGPKLKRWRMVSKWRMHWYIKHSTFIRIVLDYN